jgi:DivIVA domain-containing protein
MVLRMPDQNSASTEHALIQEITAPLGNLPADPVPEVANVDFPIVLRGYDRLAVDAYVKRISQLVAELDASRSPQNAVRRALERVGEEVSGILQRAHDTAEQITTQSRAEAEDRVQTARREAEELVANARREAEAQVGGAQTEAESLLADSQRRLKELDAETDRIWEERHRIVEDARALAAQLLTTAESAMQRFPAAEDLPLADAEERAVDEPDAQTEPGPEPGETGPPALQDDLTEPIEPSASQDTLAIEPPEPFDHESG